MAVSVAGVAVIMIVALAFLSGAIVLPPLPTAQTSSQAVTTQKTSMTTQGTGPLLRVQINIASNPITVGSTQTVSVTVLDPGARAVSNASVHVEVLYPSGHVEAFDGSTDTNGQYYHAWHIIASANNAGTFQVTVSATKDGYRTGQAKASFVATAT